MTVSRPGVRHGYQEGPTMTPARSPAPGSSAVEDEARSKPRTSGLWLPMDRTAFGTGSH